MNTVLEYFHNRYNVRFWHFADGHVINSTNLTDTKSPAFAGLSFYYIQWICCCPDVVGCGGAGTTSPGETIKRERVSVVTKVQLQLMLVH
jgi:hypothetical protein